MIDFKHPLWLRVCECVSVCVLVAVLYFFVKQYKMKGSHLGDRSHLHTMCLGRHIDASQEIKGLQTK